MKSIVVLDIQVPKPALAALFADPARCPEWMVDLERIEPIAGTLGMLGSTYRLVPKGGRHAFVCTVVEHDLPERVHLRLDSPTVAVLVKNRFLSVSPTSTRLVSEEEFHFHSMLATLTGGLAKHAIDDVHRRQIESFKAYAERRAAHA